MELREGYKLTDIGMIPEDWEVKPLGEISFIKGRIGWQGLKQTEFTNNPEEPYLITGMNFKDGEIRWDEVYHVSNDRYEVAKEIQLKENDVLLTKDGTIGKLLFVKYIPYPHKATLNSHLLVFRPLKKSYHPQYLYYNLSSPFFKKHIELHKSGTTFFGISQDSISKYQFPHPKFFKEQQAIADALNDADAVISGLEKLIAKKRSIKQGAMQKLLQLKGGYQEKSIVEIATVIRGASPRPIESSIWFDNQSRVGWVRISDVTKSKKFLSETTQKLSKAGIKHSRFVASGNLIMSICATVGRPIITTFDVCIHDGFVVFENLKVDKEFLYYYLSFVESNWSNEGQTGSQMNLNTTLIKTTKVVVPPVPKQRQIVETLAAIDSELDNLEVKLGKYQKIRQGMMQNLLTGKIRLIKKVELHAVFS